jgi:hypothetical protein
MSPPGRDRDAAGRARNARARDPLGRPLDRRADTGPPVDEPALPAEAALRRAQTLLDEGRPFEAHEVLEAVWKTTAGDGQELWRGLAQVAVGVTHALRGNESGARTLLRRGADTLAPYAGTTPDSVAVDDVRDWAVAASDDLSQVQRPPRLQAKAT